MRIPYKSVKGLGWSKFSQHKARYYGNGCSKSIPYKIHYMKVIIHTEDTFRHRIVIKPASLRLLIIHPKSSKD